MLRLVEDSFNDSYISTIGVDFKIRTIVRNGKSFKMQVWDTAGQERFRTITSSYYRGALGIVMVYDITNAVTFESIPKWLEEVDRYSQESVCKLLLGNKCDMEEERKVPQQDGERYAKDNALIFVETSAKSSANVESSFNKLVDEILETMYE
uniref:Uncharacterized protein n=1 Tax=Arcella intermedia TaxID=1963864 RepID=A0A6B2LLP3_9EUKA